MRNVRMQAMVFAASVLFMGPHGHAQAQDSPEEQSKPVSASEWFSSDVTVGAAIRDVTSGHSSRFRYGRDLPRGFYLQEFVLSGEVPGRPWRFDISGKQVGRGDQQFRFSYDRFGKYRMDARWDQHFFAVADNIQTPDTATMNGVLEVPDSIQQRFEATPDSDLPAVVSDVLSKTPFGQLYLIRRKLTVRQEYLPWRNWRLRLDLSNETRSGDRRLSVGSYVRTSTPAGDLFNTPGIEVPEPTNYRTTEVRAGISYEGMRSFMRVDYNGSFFRNRTGTLTLDNPFWFNDQLSSRFRLRRTQVDLSPNNELRTLSLLVGRSFQPWNTRFVGSLQTSFWKQDDAFLPFTLNTAIVAPPEALPAGTGPTELAALPRRSLEGNATTVSGDVVLTTRPHDKLRLVFRHNSYNWNDNTDPVEFSGYAAVGDSVWADSHGGARIVSFRHPYLRQRSTVDVVWEPHESLKWKNVFAWEGWNRENREVTRTNEWIGKTQLILKTRSRFYGKWNYSYGNRIPQGSYHSRKEFVSLRMFDQARRLSHRADFLFQINASETVNFSGSYAYDAKRYDERLYGQATTLDGYFVVDANFIPSDRFAGYVNFSRDRTRHTANLIGKTGIVDYNVPNTFIRDQVDRVESLGAGLDIGFLENRLKWNMAYAFALSQLEIKTTNPYPVDTQASTSATAFPLPDIRTRFHEVRTNLAFQLRPNVEVGLRYSYEPRFVADFTTDLMETGYIAPSAAPESQMPRRLFLNARDSSYRGHIGSVFIRYLF
jgi:MtrB/PioB family decaheme-associated outer membrane protein